jgi:hypothetical protein
VVRVVAIAVLTLVATVFLLGGYVTVTGTLRLPAGLTADDPAPTDTGPYWHARPFRVPYALGGRGWNQHLVKLFVPVDRPEARNAFLEGDPKPWTVGSEGRDVTVSLLWNGDVKFLGDQVRLGTGEDRAIRRARLQDGLAEALSARELGEGDVHTVLFNLDADAYWTYAAWILDALMVLPQIPEHVAFEVSHRFHWGHLRGRVRRAPAIDTPSATPDAPEIVLEGQNVLSEKGHSIHIGQESWNFPYFPKPDIYWQGDDPAKRVRDLTELNRIWVAVDECLACTARGRARVSVRLSESRWRVCVRYVITVLDILLDHNIRLVEFPDDGLLLELDRPATPLNEVVRTPPKAMPLVRGPLIFLALVGCAGAVVACLYGVRRLGRRPRTRRWPEVIE